MKRFLLAKMTTAFLLAFIGSTKTDAQSLNYSNWEIESADLSGGKLVMLPNETRTITYRVTAKRATAGAGVNFRFQLHRLPSGSATCGCTAISNGQMITTADFTSDGLTATKEYTATFTALPGTSLDGSALRGGDKIVLAVAGPWSPSKEYSVTVVTVTSAPKNLLATNVNVAGVTLSWTKPSGIVDGYYIYRTALILQSRHRQQQLFRV